MSVKRSCQSWIRLPGDRREVVDRLQWGLAVLVMAVGALSLARRSDLRQVLDSWFNIHALFASLLIGFSLMRLALRRQHSPLEASALSALARELSRLLYLFLYGAIGLRQIIGISRHIAYGEPIDFDPGYPLHPGIHVAGFDLNNDYHAILASGLAAWVFIRVLLYAMWLRVVDPVLGPREAESRGTP